MRAAPPPRSPCRRSRARRWRRAPGARSTRSRVAPNADARVEPSQQGLDNAELVRTRTRRRTRAAGAGPRSLGRGDGGDGRPAAAGRRQRARSRRARPVRAAVLLGLGRVLDRDHGLREPAAPVRSAPDLALASRPDSAPRRDRGRRPHRDRHADLQRGRRPRVRRAASDLGIAGRHRPARALRLLRAVRQQRSRPLRRRTRRVADDGARGRRLRPPVLSPSRAPGEEEERQHRRLPAALGRKLPLHGGDGRRQRDERRLPDDAGAHDGGASRRRHHPDRAARGRARHAVRAHAAVRQPPVRPAVHRRPALLAARRVALLGPQRDHPASRRS